MGHLLKGDTYKILVNVDADSVLGGPLVKESDILKCYDCKSTYHVICGEVTPFGNKTFVGTFKKLKVDNHLFVCDIRLIQAP